MLRGSCLLAVALALLGCGGASTSTIDGLRSPALWWEQQTGPCSSDIAIDADHAVWKSQGCETGKVEVTRVGKAVEADVDGLQTMFGSLPQPPDPRPDCTTGGFNLFARREALERTRTEWWACGSATSGDLGGLIDPYLTMAQAFQTALGNAK